MNMISKSIPPLFSILLQLSSLNTALLIEREEDTFQFSEFPFVSLYTNSVIWSVYAFLKRDIYVFTPNFTGFLIGLFASITFSLNSPKDHQFPTASHTASFSCLILTLMFFVSNQVFCIGIMGNFLAVIVLGSPLATLATVFEHKSTSSMPFATSLLSFINASAWALYGVLVVNDPLIYAPNFCGGILSLVQLIIFCIFGISNEREESSEELHTIHRDYYRDFHCDYSSAGRTDNEEASEYENECW